MQLTTFEWLLYVNWVAIDRSSLTSCVDNQSIVMLNFLCLFNKSTKDEFLGVIPLRMGNCFY